MFVKVCPASFMTDRKEMKGSVKYKYEVEIDIEGKIRRFEGLKWV